MKTQLDDLNIGDYVVLVEYYGECPTDFMGNSHTPAFDGRPFRIIAIDPPFIGVTWADKKRTIDIRCWGVKKVSRKYARVMDYDTPIVPVRSRRKKLHDDDGHLRCPRCGERLRQVQSKQFDFVFHWLCPNCRFNGGRVEST